jgi:hypothetical protein
MKVLALCDVDKNILKESTDSIYIDEDEYDVDCILDDFDCEFEQLNQSGICLDEFAEFDSCEQNEEYQGYVYREGTGYVPSGRATYNKMLCEERLIKRMTELPEEKYDVTRYKILKRTVYTVCTKYEEVC